MTLHELAPYKPGAYVNLRCRTSSANIFYKGPAEFDRKRYTPTGSQVTRAPYTLGGRVIGIENTTFPYLVLECKGEAAVIGLKKGVLRVIGTEIRVKTLHIPIAAIEKISRYA